MGAGMILDRTASELVRSPQARADKRTDLLKIDGDVSAQERQQRLAWPVTMADWTSSIW